MAKTENRRVNLWINGKEVRNDLASIRKEMSKLQGQQSRMIRGSEEYIRTGKEIRRLRGILQQHQQDLRATSASWLSMKNAAANFNKYFGMITAGVATITGVIFSFRKAADAANHFGERLSNLSALTGLTGQKLKWLADQAKQLSVGMIEGQVRVKQSADEIVDAYTKVGSQRPELLKNKEAMNEVTKDAIILSEAAKSALDPAVAALTTTMNQFNYEARDSRRIINSLAAGSKEGAADIPYLSTAIEKAGTSMSIMGLSVEQGVALVESIAPKFKEARVAGNSLDKVLLKMREQNIGYVNGVFDINAAMTELKMRFAAGESAGKLFGVEHAKMVEVMVQAQGEYNRYLDAVTDTNVALEQANINTDNNAAKLAQAQNKVKLLSIELGESLSPALTKSLFGFGKFLRLVIALPKFIKDNQVLLIALAGAVLAYNAAKIQSIAITLREIIATKAKLAADKIALYLGRQGLLLTNARAIAARIMIALTGKMTVAQGRAIVAQKKLNATMKANPLGLVILGITALISVLKLYDRYSAKNIKLEKDKKATIDGLKTANEALKKTYADISGSILQLNRLSIHEKLDLQNKIDKTLELAEAELLLFQAKQKSISTDAFRLKTWDYVSGYFKSLFTSMGNVGDQAVDLSANYTNAMINNSKEATQAIDEEINAMLDNIQNLKNQKTDLSSILNAESIGDEIGTSTLVELEEKLSQYQVALRNTIKDSDDYLRIQKKIAEISNLMGSFSGAGEDPKELERLAAEKKRLEEELAAAILKIRRELGYASMNEYDREQQKINDKYDELISKTEEVGGDVLALEELRWQELLALDIEYQQKQKDLRDKAQQDISKELESERQKAVREAEEKFNSLIELAEKYGLDSTELYQMLAEELEAIQESTFSDEDAPKDIFGMTDEDWESLKGKLMAVINIASQLLGVYELWMQKKNELDARDLDNYQKSIDQKRSLLDAQLKQGLISQKKYNASIESLDAQQEKKRKEIATDQAKREHRLNLFKAIINTASGVAEAIPNIPLVILAGILGAIQIGIIASNPPPAFGYGGFSPDKPTLAWLGDRNKKEWVASGELVEDPVTGPIIDELQRIQQGENPKWLFSQPVMPDVDGFTNVTQTPGFSSVNAFGSVQKPFYEQVETSAPVFDQMLAELRDLKEDNRSLKEFMSDPQNRKAYISHDLQKDYDNELNLLQQLSRTS
jgi:TP901 family phage tail tape measure protein